MSGFEKPLMPQHSRRGAMLVLVAALLVILMVGAAFAIDFAHIHVTRAELRTATDAAARAASENLGRTGDTDLATRAAQAAARRNTVAGRPLNLDESQIVFGANRQTSDGAFEFIAGQRPFNSVRVTGARDAGSPDGPVPMIFGTYFGVTEFKPVLPATASHQNRDIALVLDVSGSMGWFGRFPALVNAVNVFMQELQRLPQNEFVSLQVYSTNARKLVPMTDDFNSILNAISRESPRGMTAIGEGLKLGMHSFDDPQARPGVIRQIVLMTDGNHNTSVSPLVVARDVHDEGIVINTITFSRGANQTLMKSVAETTGGIHVHADDNAQLVQAFRRLANEIPVLLIE